jgi:hypothetical protein
VSTAYPGALDAFANPTSTTKRNAAGFEHADMHADTNDATEAVETKLGTGASTPAANTVLRGTGAGTTAYGQVATGDVAANAVTQLGAATGSTSGPTTTSASYADLANMSVTLTAVGGDLVCHFSGSFFNTNAFNADIGLSLDGAAEVAVRTVSLAAGSLASVVAITYVFAGVSAASHTVKVRWKTGGGTLTALGTQRDLTVWERKR